MVPKLVSVVRASAFLGFLAFTSGLLLFALLEVFPALRDRMDLTAIRYYALQKQFVDDPTLVFVPRRTGYARNTETKGDLYSPSYGVEAPTLHFVESYNEYGFRSNGPPPYQVLVIGDSYIQIGETDTDTLSERLRSASGLSTFNLGRGWYGPHQYVELLRRFAPLTKPEYALFCYFDGNDTENVREYLEWAGGGIYYDWGASRRSFPIRFWIAVSDTRKLLGRRFGEWLEARRYQAPSPTPRLRESAEAGHPPRPQLPIHPRLGVVALGDEAVAMRFTYWPREQPTEELLASPEWRTLRSLLAEFRDVARERGIVPVVLYIPTKFQTYAELVTSASGADLLEKIQRLGPFATHSLQALQAVTRDLDLRLIDLLPEFQRRARDGELLYYPFDSHWNSAGRQAAAEFIARELLGSSAQQAARLALPSPARR